MNFLQFFSRNQWWGKLLGFFFGYLIAGPAGAVLGTLIGNFFDKGLKNHFTQPQFHYHQEHRAAVQLVFFEAVFVLMGHIAKADGKVTEHEIARAKQIMAEMRLNKLQKQSAQHYFQQGKKNLFDISNILNRLETACADNPELLRLFVEIQYHYALIDGLTSAKIRILDAIFRRLGFAPLHQQSQFYEDFAYYQQSADSKNQQNSHQQSYSSPFHANATLAQAYALLEVTSHSTKEEVKRNYRRLLIRNHPDKLIARDSSADKIKLANDKTQKITKAYEMICKSKGW